MMFRLPFQLVGRSEIYLDISPHWRQVSIMSFVYKDKVHLVSNRLLAPQQGPFAYFASEGKGIFVQFQQT